MTLAKDTDFGSCEYRLLTRVKEIVDQHPNSDDELIKKFAAIVEEYEMLLKEAGKQSPAADRPRDENGGGALPQQPEEIRQMKSRLLTHITHEFLTPLNLIITPLEHMLTLCDNPEHKKIISMIFRNSQRLLLVISQVLELLKLENKRLYLKASPQNLISFLKGITASFELLAEQNEVAIILDTKKEDIPLYFEAQKMAEVMCNLVMNALKFTPPGSRITVSVREQPPGWVEISTHNTGKEIPEDQVNHIFDRFYQLNKRFEHYLNGLGIGLFLAREYIKLHYGTIEVNSGSGEGTEFVIRLPKGKTHLKPAEITEAANSTAQEEIGCKTSKQYAYLVQLEREGRDKAQPVNNETPAVDEKGESEKDMVLVIEDNSDMRNFIKSVLAGEKFVVIEADNGRQGIKLAKENIPDIIISDIMMPDVNGYQVCRELKKNITTSHIPIILLSVKFTQEEIVQGLEAGADDYITKPFSMDILLTRIKNLVKMRRLLQQRVQWETITHPDELGLSSLDNRLLNKIQQAVENNLADPDFGQNELADAIGMSKASLYRKVMALTGQSPGKFIQAYRLKRSVDLLKADHVSVTEVAFSVGFASSAYFTKCFKEKFGRLPSNFFI